MKVNNKVLYSSRMARCTLEKLKIIKGVVEVSKSGRMVVSMKDIGKTIKHGEKVALSIVMEIFTMVNGNQIALMVEVSTFTVMELSTKVIGLKITRMGMVKNNGLMELLMKVNIKKGRRTVSDTLNGRNSCTI